MALIGYLPNIKGATSVADGDRGYAPQPLAGEQNLFLRASGDFVMLFPDWAATEPYSTGAIVFQDDAIWRRNSAGTSGATFDASEEAEWTKMADIGGGGGSADNLGDHTATQALDMATFNILNIGEATATAYNVVGTTNDWTVESNGADDLEFNYNGTPVFRINQAGSLTIVNTVDGRDVATDGTNQDALQTLSGVSAGSSNLGTFSGSVISDNITIKAALQEIETSLGGVVTGLTPQGTWNAATNTPDLTAGGNQVEGHYYRVSADGTTNLDGISEWKIGDHLFYAQSAWHKIDNTDQFVNLTVTRDATSVTVVNDLGTDGVLPIATTSLAGVMSAADKTALDNLDAAGIKTLYESNANTNAFTDAEQTKIGHISVTQAVDLDTLESDVGTNNSKLSATTANVDAAGATMNTDTDVSGNAWVIDEDDLISNDPTKVPSQQSVKAYVDSQGGGGNVTNNYSVIGLPQLFNPDATAVTNDTDDYTLSSSNNVALVTINGSVLDDSEYSLAGNTLTVTPDNGFNGTDDEVLVFQHSFITSSTGVVTSFTTQAGNYTVLATDHTVKLTGASPTCTVLTAVGRAGQEFIIKHSGTGTATVDTTSSQTIDGNVNVLLSTNDALTVKSDGANWIII